MNDADKHIDSWSITDVQRYLNGELSARERHDLEKQALDDPFLADALEGLQTQSGETLHQDLAELRTRLDTRIATNRKRPWLLLPVRAAAVIILLVGLGFTAYRTLFYKGQPATAPVATREAPPAASNEAPAPATSVPPGDSAAPPVAAAPAVAAIRPVRHPAAKAQTKVQTKAQAEGHIELTESRVRPTDTAAAAVALREDVLKSVYIPDSLNIRKDTRPYPTNTDENKMRLGSSANLDEVVVSGIGAKRKEYRAASPSDTPETLDSLWLNTAPTVGRIAYLEYLTTARKTLPVDTAIHGTESISFLVDKKGALTEFKIERSLSPAHDAGVIRLITEGSPWKMLHGRSARALVNVTFQ